MNNNTRTSLTNVTRAYHIDQELHVILCLGGFPKLKMCIFIPESEKSFPSICWSVKVSFPQVVTNPEPVESRTSEPCVSDQHIPEELLISLTSAVCSSSSSTVGHCSHHQHCKVHLSPIFVSKDFSCVATINSYLYTVCRAVESGGRMPSGITHLDVRNTNTFWSSQLPLQEPAGQLDQLWMFTLVDT